MIVKQAQDWLQAACDGPRARAARLRSELGAFESVCARVELGFSSEAPFARASVRLFAAPGAFARASRLARRRWRVQAAPLREPDAGWPFARLEWDLGADRLVEASVLGAGPSAPGRSQVFSYERGPAGDACALLRRRAWPAGLLEDARVAAPLSAFAALCSVEYVFERLERGEGGAFRPTARWGLGLSRGVPWPSFGRLDLASPFAGEATRLAFLLLDRRVKAVDFEEGRLCAYLGA